MAERRTDRLGITQNGVGVMSMRENLERIEERIVKACDSAGRSRDEVTLIAVGKTRPVETLREAYDLGVRQFGENRFQEADEKIDQLPSDIVWHYIGKLQSNKARRAAERMSVIHTLESDSQLRKIANGDRIVDGLIEVNLGREPQKSGIFAENLDEYLEKVTQCSRVRFRGLMTVPPLSLDPEECRTYFRQLRKLGDGIGAEWLSMGMTADFEVAIQEGATHIRVGTAIFGERK